MERLRKLGFSYFFAFYTKPLMKGVMLMLSLKNKTALVIVIVESVIFCNGFRCVKKYTDNQYLYKYGMTAKEYINAVMKSENISDYNR